MLEWVRQVGNGASRVRPRAAVKTKPAAVRQCRLLGAPLTDEEMADRDLYQLREWRWCLHAAKPLGEAVCPCVGCGQKCGGYATSPATS